MPRGCEPLYGQRRGVLSKHCTRIDARSVQLRPLSHAVLEVMCVVTHVDHNGYTYAGGLRRHHAVLRLGRAVHMRVGAGWTPRARSLSAQSSTARIA
jgi:hypothetical protein